jgi:hypothetical protein
VTDETTARDALVASLACSDGFPVPSAERFAERVLEQLKARGWDVRPSNAVSFQPAAAEYHPGEQWVPWLWRPSGHVHWHTSANEPPAPGGQWSLLYVRTRDGEVQ